MSTPPPASPPGFAPPPAPSPAPAQGADADFELDLDLEFDAPERVAAAAAPAGPAQPRIKYEDDDVTRVMPAARIAPAVAAAPTQAEPVARPDDSETTIIRPAAPRPPGEPPGPAASSAASSAASPAASPAVSPAASGTQPPATPPRAPAAVAPPAAATPPRPPGAVFDADGVLRQLGPYQIRARLGRGGVANVFRAVDLRNDREVALKLLHPPLADDAECRARFLREARAAGTLSHPHIVRVLESGEIDSKPYLAMELVSGRSLAEILAAHRVMPVRDVMTLGRQLGEALAHAHAKGVVHRDIKPANVLLAADGSGIRVADFGIAHLDGGEVLPGGIIGTPAYMAPEQARGEAPGPAADLFSAGVLLYEALTGERPFAGDSVAAVRAQHERTVPASIESRRPDVPTGLRRVVMRCLARHAGERFASGTELASAMAELLSPPAAAAPVPPGAAAAAAGPAAGAGVVPAGAPAGAVARSPAGAVAQPAGQAAREPASAVAQAAAADHPAGAAVAPAAALPLARLGLLLLLLAVVIGGTAAWALQRQGTALLAQSAEQGAALTRFVAAQQAAAVLGEEWDVVDVAVQETMKSGRFERIVVADKNGVVRASTLPDLVGKPYRMPEGETLPPDGSGVAVGRYNAEPGPVLGFEAPVTFVDQRVGMVALGLSEASMLAAGRQAASAVTVLAVVAWLAAALALVVVARGGAAARR